MNFKENLLITILYGSSSFNKYIKIKLSLKIFDTTVAIATPDTSNLYIITSIKFNIIFITPAMIKDISGRFVSP